MATQTAPASLPLYFNGRTFEQANTGDGKLPAPKAGSSNYILVGCKESLTSEQESSLESTGAIILSSSGGTTFVCKYNAATLGPVRSLPFVSSANVYPQNLVVHPTVVPYIQKARDAQGNAFDAQHRFPAIIRLHQWVEGDGVKIREELAKIVGLSKSDTVLDGSRHLRASLRRQDFDAAAAHNEVQSIEVVPGNEYLNHVARRDLNVPVPDNNNNNPGLGAQGKGIVVAVTDSGFDVGDAKDLHPAFDIGQIKALTSLCTGEVKTQWEKKNPGLAAPDAGDRVGHGTHVAGSIVGNGSSKVFGPVQGTAPAAKLYIQSVGNAVQEFSLWGCGLTLSQIFEGPLAEDAYIHNISWETRGLDNNRQGYINEVAVMDEIVWKNKKLLVVQGAGNSGNGKSDLRDPGTGVPDRPKQPRTWGHIDGRAIAKNILTVGATESTRPFYKLRDPYVEVGDDPDSEALIEDYYRFDEGKKPNLDGSCYNVAPFSSCGPAKAPGGREDNVVSNPGRNKPDLVAPGAQIYSARSRHKELSLMHKLPRDGNAPQRNNFDYYGVSPPADQDQYMFLSGTSHATPLVAGCAAVISEALASAGQERPPASAIKAVLLNNTLDLSSTGKNKRGPPLGPAPDGAQGYGLVDLQSALINVKDPKVGKVVLKGGPLSVGGLVSYWMDLRPMSPLVPIVPITLSVTLVWTDFPHEEIVNSLRLKVINSKGEHMHGNMRTLNPADNQYDDKNNVQKVEWDNIPPGPTSIEVSFRKRRRIDRSPDSQEFSVVWHVRNGNFAP